MKNNFEYLTDDELVLECVDLLNNMMRENSLQMFIAVFLLAYNLFSFFGFINFGYAWYLTQVMCWGLYCFHAYRYGKKQKTLTLYKEEMIKRDIL